VTGKEIRVKQRFLISEFIASVYVSGKYVLDFGCGNEPHRDLVESAGGIWVGWNREMFPGANAPDVGPDDALDHEWDVIVCAQMLQYVPSPPKLLAAFKKALAPGGCLVLTYATNWPEVEAEDLWRFTRSGMEFLLKDAGLSSVKHKRLGSVPFGDREEQAHGYGVVAIPAKT
jgi:SAM-dependent methyltransferase